MPLNSLTRWFCDHGCFIKTRSNQRDTRAPTHLLLSGGKIHVPDADEDTFLTQYADSVARGEYVYVVEARTPVYKFLMDLDFTTPEETGEPEIQDVLRVVHETVAACFPGRTAAQCRMVVCRTDNKTINKHVPGADERMKLIKTGIHLIWPEVLVDSELALRLREVVLYRLTEEFGHRPAYNPWSDVVDRCVYAANGLRMVGSRKMTVCPACRNRPAPKKECTQCGCRGRIDEGRPYVPAQVLQGHGFNPEALAALQDRQHMVRELTIRTRAKAPLQPSFPEWAPAPASSPDRRPSAQRRRRSAERTRKSAPVPTEHEFSDGPVLAALPVADRRHRTLATFIRTYFPQRPEITHVHPTEPGDYYLARSNSRFCLNKGSRHNHNTVYFFVDKRGVRQKCFCRCDVQRRFGRCAEYSSAVHPISEHVRRVLWPTQYRRRAQTAQEDQFSRDPLGWLADMIRRDRDYVQGRAAYEAQFFDGHQQ